LSYQFSSKDFHFSQLHFKK